MQGPGSLGVVSEITVVSGAPGTGVFIYKAAPARGTLIAAAVGTGGTDPTGLNTVSPVLAVGVWSAVTGLPGGQSMVDAFGNLTVQGTDGQARLKIWTGADGISNHHAGAVWWLNDFGAVLQVIDPVTQGNFQYQDTGSATQGGLLGAQMSRTTDTTDPIGGFVVHPGITIIDPVFGDNLSIQGDVVGFDQLGMTRKCFISSQDPGPSTTLAPYLLVEAPEHTAALHAVTILYGETQDGTTHPPKVLYAQKAGSASDPLVKTSDYLEIQPVSGQNAIQAFMLAAADRGFNTRVTGDTTDRFGVQGNGVLLWSAGSGVFDVNLYRAGAGIIQTDSNLHINGSNILCFAQAANATVFRANATGDTFDAFLIDNRGHLQWGTGAAAVDTNLARNGVGALIMSSATGTGLYVLSISPTVSGNGGLGVTMQAAGDFALAALITGDTAPRWRSHADGSFHWSPGSGSADTDLFRQAASELKTSGQFDCNILFAATKAVLANQGSAPANLAGDTQMVGSNADMMFTIGANNTKGFVPVSNSDATQYTVTAASATAISNAWNIPAGAANAGAAYEMKVFGHGKQGSTQQALTITFVLNGAAIFTATLPATWAAISANFGFDVELKVLIATTGVSGTMWAEMRVSSVTSLVVGALLATQAFNTTVGNNLGIDAQWAATTGAPTITSNANTFVKVA